MDIFRLATWNVITLDSDEKRNTIFEELKAQNIDLACLQETKFSSCEYSGENHTIFCYESDAVRSHIKCPNGVGFAVKNSLMNQLKWPYPQCSNRLTRLTINLSNIIIHIINVYAPTNAKDTSAVDKDKFYNVLEDIFSKIPECEKVFIIGDFNAQVGADDAAWPTCLGDYGVREINDNGQRLLEFCSLRNLCVLNTYFDVPESERFTHQHKGHKTWSQLDLCISRDRDRNIVISTRPVKNMLNDFDHKMVILEIDMKPLGIEILMFRYLLCTSLQSSREIWFGLDDRIKNRYIYEFPRRHLIEKYIELLQISSSLITKNKNNGEEVIKWIAKSIIDILMLFLDTNTYIEKNNFDIFLKETKIILTSQNDICSLNDFF